MTSAAPALPRERALDRVGRSVLRVARLLRELLAFALITLGVILTKRGDSRKVVHPLIVSQIWQAGVRLLPMLSFFGVALGLVIIGQTVALLSRVGAQQFIGTVMVGVVVRELGPLLTALLVIARAGTATVVELGTMRAFGEVRALESLGIDPIHYLVMPRMLGLAAASLCLTTYLVLTALLSGYLFIFLQEIPLTPSAYFGQLADALIWQDFALLASKTALFGVVIAVVHCYHGLARRLEVEEISSATARAVVHSVIGCAVLDAFFLLGYVFT